MITREELRDLFYYEPSTGWLIRRKKTAPNAKIGDIAGTEHKQGYWAIHIKGQPRLAHRLIWLYHYGKVPKSLDHINGNKQDNRIENLRPCTISENGFNRYKQTNNTSGYKGVSWHKANSKWRATIVVNRKQKHLGNFDTPEEAYAEYMKAAKELHGDFCYGMEYPGRRRCTEI